MQHLNYSRFLGPRNDEQPCLIYTSQKVTPAVDSICVANNTLPQDKRVLNHRTPAKETLIVWSPFINWKVQCPVRTSVLGQQWRNPTHADIISMDKMSTKQGQCAEGWSNYLRGWSLSPVAAKPCLSKLTSQSCARWKDICPRQHNLCTQLLKWCPTALSLWAVFK